MNKAVFLDRDGTINEDDGYTYKIKDYKLIPNVIKALNQIKDKFKLFIITNQSGVGRGYYSLKDAKLFNDHLISDLAKHNIKIEKTLICPHHPSVDCDCRKPNTTFINNVKKEYKLDLHHSYTIGDHESDIKMGKNAGTKTILVLTGHGKKHLPDMKVTPDYIAEDLLDAVKCIIKNE